MTEELLNAEAGPAEGLIEQAEGPAQADQFGGDRARWTARQKRFANGQNVMLAGLVSVAVGGVYLLSLRSGPAKASAEQVRLEAAVDTALSQLNKAPTLRARAGGADVCDVFYYEAKHRQISAKELKGNPFCFKGAEEKPIQLQTLPSAQASADEVQADELSQAMELVGGLELQSVVAGARGSSAMINNNLLTIGQTIRGWTVSEIRPREVVLRWRQQTYVLRIAE